MNMIFNKSDLVGYEAVDRTDAKKSALAKIVAAWESKQAKNATRLGGFGLLAVSLAACNSSSDDTATATPTTTTPAVTTPTTLTSDLTTGTDIITSTMTSGDDSITATFTNTAATDTLSAGDVVVDVSSTDNDTLTINSSSTAAVTTTAFGTVSGVENIVFNNSGFHLIDNDLAGIVSGTITINNTQIGGSTGAAANNVGSSVTVKAGSGVTGTMRAELTNGSTGATIDSGAATQLDVTGIGSEAQTLTSKATTINLQGEGDTGGDTATLTSAGTVALNSAANLGAADQVENLSLSGNAAAVTFTDAGTPTTVTMTGSQNVTYANTFAKVTAKAITDSSTGTSTLSITDTVTGADLDLSKAAVDALSMAVGVSGDQTITLANNANLTFVKKATSTFSLDASDGSATNTTITAMTANIALTEDEDKAIKIDNTAGTGQDTITTLNITNSTVAQTGLVITGTASGTGATTVNLSGSKAVAVGASTVSKLDASGLTAALTVTTSANMLDVKGGSGDDGITALTGVKNVIDGGAGTDTLTTGADMSTSTFSNIEILKLGANTDVLASQISGKTFVVTAANALEINAANSMDISTVDLSTLVPDLSAKPSFVIDATTGFKAATFNTGQTFDLTGSSVDDTINGYANADTIKGGGGADTIDGKAGADNIDGGAGADNITGGTGADIITTGAGADTVNVGVADASASAGTADATVASTTGFDTITDFTVGATGDKIDVGAASSIAANAGATTTAKTGKITAGTVTFNAADDTLAEKIIAAEAAMGNAAAGEACMFQHESDAYILVSDGTDTLGVNDALIKLTGIDTTATTSDVLTAGAAGVFTIV